MSLTNRLSLFFLAALALVLVGFSAALFHLAQWHLRAQLNDRLDATMTSLVAAVEIHPGDVQGEPLERRIVFGEDPAPDEPRWTLHDLAGRLKDRSHNLTSRPDSGGIHDHGWRVQIRRLRAGHFTPEAVDGTGEAVWVGSLAETAIEKARETPLPEDRTFESDGMVITVAASEAPVVWMLQRLALVLATVSATIWIAAALSSRWFCSRVLRPVSRMATSARLIREEPETQQMLDVPSTGDELEDLGQAFNALLANLRESLERQRRFTGDASHQLRTPLTAMLASVEVALRHERSSSEYQRVLETVRRRGGQLHQIIESLLFLARADGASLLGDPEQMDVNDWCQTWLENWSDHPRAGDIAFRGSQASAEATTHPGLLGQVLDSLLDNACKYSEPGTPITVDVEARPNHVGIIVSDCGYGIAEDQQARIFEPFFRTKEVQWQGKNGIGLGLAIVKRLAVILGAKVEVLSESGRGSRFAIILRAEANSAAQEKLRGEKTVIAQNGKSR
jgi:signal transduction histidine kinase